MPPSSKPAERLLHLLLDRFEAPKQRVRDITQTIDYTQVGDPTAQDEFHQTLHDAERAGGIILEKERLGRFTGEYARVRLTDPARLYEFLVREPSGAIASEARHRIATAIPEIVSDPFFAEIEGEAFEVWKSNRSFLGLTVQQVDTLVTVMRLAYAILHLTGRDMDHRTFSRRVVKDSKALERNEGRVAQLLKRKNPSMAGDEPREILEASGIVRRAHLLQVKGPLALSSHSLQIDGTGEIFIGLPWAAVQHARLAQSVDYVLTIENPTSFWRYCAEVRGNYLALLTDGFPARDVLSGIVHLVRAARASGPAPIYHWGDVDAGGLRIAAHLEEALGLAIALHDMEPAVAVSLGTSLQSLKGLDLLSKRQGDIGALARWLLSADAKALEQEELDPCPPEIHT